MSEHLNTFQKGMDQDSAKSFRKKESYISAENFRQVTEDGESSGVLETVLGNLNMFDFPNVTSIATIIVDSAVTGNLRVQMTGGFDETLTITAVSTVENLVEQIKNKLTLTPFDLGDFVVATSGDRIVFYSTSDDISSITGTLIGPSVSQSIALAEPNLTPIGYCTIRDEVIVFTTSETSGTGQGQIWRFEYDKDTLTLTQAIQTFGANTPELLYNGALNFSTENPIDREAIGRFETPDIKRIYWTDNTNSVRTVNIEDEELLAKDPELLNLVSSVKLSKPRVTGIGSTGRLLTGIYSYAYRLKSTGGVQTEFSRLSPSINIALSDLNNQYKDYDGGDPNGGEDSGKF
jgi:hypothetical protein